MRAYHFRLTALTGLFAALLATTSLYAAAPVPGVTIVVPQEDDLLLCALVLERDSLSEAIETYVTPRGMMLPFGEICRLLEFNITVDPAAGIASGWLADNNSPFSLDMRTASAKSSGKGLRYDPALVEAHASDIFVESALASEWLGIPLDANRYAAAVTLKPRQRLPLQLRLDREKRGGLSGNYGVYARPVYADKAQAYRILGGASLDFSVGKSVSFNGGAATEGPYTFGMRMTGDVLWMSASLGLTGEIRDSPFVPRTMNAVLRRMDPDGNMLGFMHAREIAIGNITPVSPPLFGASSKGLGLVVGNYPFSSPTYFDLQTLEGYLLPGWDVELYRNDSRLDYRKADADGAYSFKDIPLLFGKNILKLVFNGPMGQQKIEEHVYNVGSNMSPPCSYSYRASATLEDAGPQFGFQQVYGLSKAITLNSSLLTVQYTDGRNLYAGLAMAGYFRNVQLDASAAMDVRHSGFSGDLGLRSQFLGLGLSFRVSAYDLNWKQANPAHTTPPYLEKATLRIDNLRWTSIASISPLYLSFSETLYRSGNLKNRVELSQYHSGRVLRFSHHLNFEHNYDGVSTSTFALDGNSSVSARLGIFNLNGGLSYRLVPAATLDTANASVGVEMPWAIRMQTSVSYNFNQDVFSGSTALYSDVSPVRIGLSGNWSTTGAWSLALTASTNLSSDCRTGAVVMDSQALASQASISARAFLDSNYNGKWDKGENFLEGVKFLVNEREHETRTGANGVAFLRGLQPNVRTNVSVYEASLEDLLLVSALKGLSCVTRPGLASILDFPVWMTGEVAGTVYSVKNGVKSISVSARVEILDSNGVPVRTVRSAYDGYYSFTALKAGSYTVRVQKQCEPGDKLEYVSAPIVIPAEGGYLDGIDLTCEVREASAEFRAEDLSAAVILFIPVADTKPATTTEPVASIFSTPAASRAVVESFFSIAFIEM